MPTVDRAVVTGAFSYTGGHIARLLLGQGVAVTTLSRHPDLRDEFAGAVATASFDFDDPGELRRTMEGASVFYNTRAHAVLALSDINECVVSTLSKMKQSGPSQTC